MKHIGWIGHAKFCIVLVVLFVGLASFAEAADQNSGKTMIIDGLTFFCNGCQQLSQNQCRVVVAQQPSVMTCSPAAREFLLNEAARHSQAPAYPTPEELIRYLLIQKAAPQDARSAFLLLFRSNKGLFLLVPNVRLLARTYRELWIEFVKENEGPADFWKEVSKLPYSVENQSSFRLHIALMTKEGSSLIELVANELTGSDAEFDKRFLNEVLSAAKTFKHKDIRVLEAFSAYRDKCVNSFGSQKPQDECNSGFDELWPEKIKSYLRTAQFQQILQASRTGTLSNSEFLNAVVRLDYKSLATPDFYQRMFDIIEQCIGNSACNSKLLMSDESLKTVFEFLSSQDERIKGALEELKKQDDKTAKQKALFIASLLLIIVLVGVGSFFYKRKQLHDTSNSRVLLERQELNDLLVWFYLPADCTVEELSQSFRNKAKEAHPDVETGNDQSFAELQQKHKRAQELLAKFRSR